MLNNSIANKLFGDDIYNVYKSVVAKWDEPHRVYHSRSHHLHNLLSLIHDLNTPLKLREILEILAFFHDYEYDPQSISNERDSAQAFMNCLNTDGEFDTDAIVKIIYNSILETGTLSPSTEISKQFIKLDFNTLINGSVYECIEDTKLIFKEFEFCSVRQFKEGRMNFFNGCVDLGFGIPSDKIEICKQFLRDWNPNVGVYAGSFYPFHKGHLNILQKAEKIFDKVIIVQAQNPEKSEKGEKFNNVNKILKHKEVINLNPKIFLTKFLKDESTYSNITLIRGLRNGNDFNYELNQLRFMEDMYPEIKVVFIPCDREHEYVSSSAIRSIANINEDESFVYRCEIM